MKSFQSPSFAPDMARILPFVGSKFSFSQLGSGATDIGTMQAPPTNIMILDASWYNKTVWTAGGGDTTGLTGAMGIASNTDLYLEEAQIDLLAAGVWSPLGGLVKASMVFTAAPAPVMEFVPTGGSTELDHIDAGEGIGCLFYARLPDGAKLWDLCSAASF